MKKVLALICLGIIMIAASQVMAEDSKPIQLSITPDIAIFDRPTRIQGFTLGIWSENPQDALALGFVNGSKGVSTGFSWAILFNYADTYKGVQWSLVNYTKANFFGWQYGIFDYAGDSMKGAQTGLVNYAGNLSGLQLGLVNYAAKATAGVQIGVVNIIPENKWFTEFPSGLAPGMIIVNWRF